ncbi:hypothetical protein D3C78_1662110 [compost metagenome]
MFGLRQEIGSDKRRGCAAVGDHQHLRRACGHIDGRTVQALADLTFGFGHEGVTRPEDFRYPWHRIRAKRHGGNRLRATDLEHFLHATEFGGIQDLIGNRRW